MERKDTIFLLFLAAGIVALLMLASRPPKANVIATVDVPNDTEIVGMSLSPDSNPPETSPFTGRFCAPPPLAAMLPVTGS